MCIKRILARALGSVPAPSSSTDNVIHLALSGGVDSSVSGFLLRERGWRVRPIFLRCWSSEDGDCVERELRAAESATRALQLQDPLSDWDFVKEYWHNVFESVLLRGLSSGLTPNPDVACNRFVKFGAFPRRLRESEGREDVRFATGHYARLETTESGPRLLLPLDKLKDQTYFLAGVNSEDFRGAMFPLSNVMKQDARSIASYAGLPSAKSKSSRGLCFVGARRLPKLIENYLATDRKPNFVDESTLQVIEQAPSPAWAYTIGQRARIAGLNKAYYVCDKANNGDILVTQQGTNADVLQTTTLRCRRPHWIGGSDSAPKDGASLSAKTKNSGEMYACYLSSDEDGIVVRFQQPVRRIGPGQVVALYEGDVCLGSSLVA